MPPASPGASRQQHQGALSHEAQAVGSQLGAHEAGQVIVGAHLGVIAFASTVPVSVEIPDVTYDSTRMASSLSFFIGFPSPEGVVGHVGVRGRVAGPPCAWRMLHAPAHQQKQAANTAPDT
jgi:hypothetical protein